MIQEILLKLGVLIKKNLKATVQTNWYVITGGPSSGKTTVVQSLQDLGYKTSIEAARHYIDLQRMNGKSTEEVRDNQRSFQHKVLNLQIKIEKRLDPTQLVFLDRALPDELAYYKHFDIEPDRKLIDSLNNFLYKKVFIMELLPLAKDYARVEDKSAQISIQKLIIQVYKARSEPVIMVPVMSVEERTRFILDNLN